MKKPNKSRIEETRTQFTDVSLGKLIEELQQTVSTLEDENLDIEDQIKQYEIGLALIETAQSRLSGFEQKVVALRDASIAECSKGDK